MAKQKKQKLSKLEKSKLDPNSKFWRNKAYKIWTLVAKKKSGNGEFGKCAICGACDKPADCHHLLPRELKRWWLDTNNCIVLCKTHHNWSRLLSAHKASMQFAFWMEENRPEQYNWIKEQVKKYGEDCKILPMTLKEAYERLLKEFEELTKVNTTDVSNQQSPQSC